MFENIVRLMFAAQRRMNRLTQVLEPQGFAASTLGIYSNAIVV